MEDFDVKTDPSEERKFCEIGKTNEDLHKQVLGITNNLIEDLSLYMK